MALHAWGFITLAQQISNLSFRVLAFLHHFLMASPSKVGALDSSFKKKRIVDYSDNCLNCIKSGPPQRMMFYFHGEWNDFPKLVTASLIEAFREGKTSVGFNMGGCNFMADFLRMVMTDLDSQLLKYIAWIDEYNECYFPKFISDHDEAPDTFTTDETSQMDSSYTCHDQSRNVVTMSPKLMGEEENNSPKLPSHVNSGFEPVHERLSEQERGSYHYTMVHNSFLAGMCTFVKPSDIVAIHRYIPKDHIEKAFSTLFQKQIEIASRCPRDQNVQWAWIGMSREGIIEILQGRFLGRQNLSKGMSNGIGVNFSPRNCAYVSASDCEVDENGMHHMLLCRVIIGNMEHIQPGTNQFFSSSNNFDAGVNVSDNPKLYFIWSSLVSHIHPEWVVSFKMSPTVEDYFAMLKDWLVSSIA